MKYLYVIILALFMNSCKTNEKALFYVPEGYQGTIIVVFDQENGQEKEYKNKKRVYRIPESGVLYSKFEEPVAGTIDHKYFYLKDNDILKQINLYIPYSEKHTFHTDSIYILEEFNGGYKSYIKEKNIKYLYSSIGKLKDKERLINEAHNKIKEFQKQ